MNPVQDRAERILTEMCSLVDELSKLSFPKPALAQDNRKKLSKREVENIRSMKRSGYKVTEIARSFDIHHATVSRIVRGHYHK